MKRGGANIVITYPHSLGAGGGGTVGCLQITRHLQALGANLVVIPVMTLTRDHTLFRNPPLPENALGHAQEAELRDLGIEVVRVRPSRVHWLLDGRPTLRAVKSVLARQRIDAVLGWHQEYSFVPRLLRRRGIFAGQFVSGDYSWATKSGKPHPTWTSAQRAQMAKSTATLKGKVHWWIQRQLLLASLEQVDVVFAISEYTRDVVAELCEIPLERFTIAHWGVDPVFGTPRRTPPAKITNFLFYGSAARRKGGFETLRAFGELWARGHRDFRVRLVWQYHDELDRVAREVGIRDRVELFDPMDHRGLADQLGWAHVAILPSTFESFGLACAEAQFSGVPVIAYDVGGVKEIVAHHETGWLLPCERSELLPGAILEAMADPARTYAMGMTGRERAQDSYSWEHTARTILATVEAGSRNGRA